MKKTASLFSVPYLLWLLLFVVAPVLMLLYQSFFDISGNFTLDNYGTFFSSWTYLRMSFNSVLLCSHHYSSNSPHLLSDGISFNQTEA